MVLVPPRDQGILSAILAEPGATMGQAASLAAQSIQLAESASPAPD